MTADAAPAPRPYGGGGLSGWLTRLAARPGFQAWAARFPLTRGRVRREGAALFDLVAGFCHSQVLLAFVELDLPGRLAHGPRDTAALALACAVPEARMQVLLQAAASLGLLRRLRGGRWRLTVRGAAVSAVPGLAGMIRHHPVLYGDLADPAAFFRGQTDPALARFWPYVFGPGAADDPATAERYSRLMADSQALVAADTLAMVELRGVRHLLDIGGGTGSFLIAAAAAAPQAQVTLMDLPAVAQAARARLEAAGLAGRSRIVPGDFRGESLPDGADAISLVRVLYDHADDTARALVAKVHAALPPGGRLIVSEPMAGGTRPERAGDAYFALYTLAMGTGKARSQEEIAALLRDAGFVAIRAPRPQRPFVTAVVEARKPG
jgi:demethylspheroidene O-methyltransferase